MAAIILYHTGTPIPAHLQDCVQSIRRQSAEIPIYLITDQEDLGAAAAEVRRYDPRNPGVFAGLEWLQELTYFNASDLPAMWRGSCFRLFYIQRLMEHEFLDNVLHFDNDVLLFSKPEELIATAERCYSRCAITPLNQTEVCFGMAFFPGAIELGEVVRHVRQELQRPWAELVAQYDGFPNEMRLLASCPRLDYLPVVPPGLTSQRYTLWFNHFAGVFDPASYGQYLGGTFSEKQPGWVGKHQEPGRYIHDGQLRVEFVDGSPYVLDTTTGGRHKIHNLHIHSKNTQAFL